MKFRSVTAISISTLALFASSCAPPTLTMAAATAEQERQLDQLIAKMEGDVVEFARQVEAAYQDRCTTALSDCALNNYDGCASEFPNPTCHKSEELAVEACSASASDNCAALFDFTTSNIRLPRDVANGKHGNPTDPQVIESVCYTRQLDEYFQKKRQDDAAFWNSSGVESPNMHFGSNEGMFRIFPGRSDEVCGSYDPRLRPWYIAASSGPKNVVMVLDTSGSMKEGQRMDLLKQAATRVIQTLTVSDRVAIVPFSSTAGPVIGDSSGRLLTATENNKAYLVKAIDDLVADGGTNFYDAFEHAFDSLDQSVEAELNVPCNSVILFLTDGEMTEPKGMQETTVIDLVSTRLNTTMQATGKPVMLFTYSISDNDSNVHTFPKQLACSTGELGVWSKIVNDGNLVESLNSYYRLFALGLAQDRNMDFVAWVEPYPFATGGVMGTTASAPVYDRTRSPYLFLGVVGIDFPLAALNKALGVESWNNQGVLDRIVRASTAKCPSLNLTVCELESFRRQSSAGDDALCTPGFCSEDSFVVVESTKCPGISDYPYELWANSNFMGKSYEDRVCCALGESVPSTTCTASNGGLNKTAIVIISVLSISGVCLVIAVYACVRKSKERYQSGSMSKSGAVIAEQVIMPPPPAVNPAFRQASTPSSIEGATSEKSTFYQDEQGGNDQFLRY